MIRVCVCVDFPQQLDKDGLISRLVDLILAQNPKHTVALKGAEVGTR